MPRRYWLTLASLACATSAYAQDAREPLIVEFRLDGQSVSAVAWRDGDALYAEPATFRALDLRAPTDSAEQAPLNAVPGLSYHYDDAQGAVLLSCTSACFPNHVLERDNAERTPLATDSGGFLNMDLTGSAIDGNTEAAGGFDLGLFGPRGAGGTSWIITSERGAVRLDTQWVIDRPGDRASWRLGDSISVASTMGAPFRFGGVQLATNFALDPSFITFPTPTLHGEAATPSTVDLYVDGALRSRQETDSGPFTIMDAPVLSGAGVAQIVVTDALGRERVYAQPFYASPVMLRSGLSDYAFQIGAERRNYTLRSDDYGPGFVSGRYRYGFSNLFTGEAGLDVTAANTILNLAGSTAAVAIGQIDAGIAYTAHGETTAKLGWSDRWQALSLSAEVRAASRDFTPVGDDAVQPQLETAISLGADLGDGGAVSLAYTAQDWRNSDDVRTAAITYAPRVGEAQLGLSALYVDADRASWTLGVSLSMALNDDMNMGAGVTSRDGRIAAMLSAQRSVLNDQGFGWQISASGGDLARADGDLTHIGGAHELRLDFSHTEEGDGLRGQFSTAIAWIGGDVMVTRPVRNAFALVRVGTPGVRVMRDRRVVGVTDARGDLMLTGLRANEDNRIGVVLDDLPFAAETSEDEIQVRPGARGGAIAHFDVTQGAAGEIRVVDAHGAPLAAGSVLRRASDGARFAVGADGRTYLSGVASQQQFASADCLIDVAARDVDNGGTLQCRVAP